MLLRSAPSNRNRPWVDFPQLQPTAAVPVAPGAGTVAPAEGGVAAAGCRRVSGCNVRALEHLGAGKDGLLARPCLFSRLLHIVIGLVERFALHLLMFFCVGRAKCELVAFVL